jgi:oligopeptidase B
MAADSPHDGRHPMPTREAAAPSVAAGAPPRAPVATRRPVVSEWHGHARTDDYAWLRDDKWQQVMRDPSVLNPDIRAYLEAENAYAAAAMADVEPLRLRLFAEMRGRIKEDDSTVPAPDGAYAYASRYRHGAEHPEYVRTRRDGGDERVLIDAEALAAGKAYFHLGGVAHSPDHRLVAYAADDSGNEYYTMRIRDADSGIDYPETFPETNGGPVWANGETLFYVWVDGNHRPAKVFRHTIGASPNDDAMVFEESNPALFISVGRTQSDRYVVINTHDHDTSELHVIDTADPTAAPRLVSPRRTEVEYSIDHGFLGGEERFFILTNADGAEDFKIVTAPVDAPDAATWVDLVPHRPGCLILDITVYRDHLVRLEREGGLPRIVIRHLATGEEHAIAFDEEAYSLGVIDGYEFDTTTLRFTYSSMTTPARVYDYDMATRSRVLRKQDEVPSGHDPDDYVTRRVMAPAADGETVPVSLLYRKGTPLDGSAPCLLYGYGAYGITIPAAFGTSRLSLVDRGFVYAIAHIRGGKDKGYRWYADGRRENKPNTFSDFIAAGEYLAAEGFTSRGRIVGWGGSAGGLLIGTVANMAPDLFAGLIADVPFVDTLNTMLDASLPLTPPEWTEWGNPIESEADYRLILSYSPYDNVRPQAYPAILALAGLSDPRVTYWEPAKWVAKLRATATGSNPIVFRTNMDAGHGGAAGRFDRLHETAFATAFALKVAGHEDARAA